MDTLEAGGGDFLTWADMPAPAPAAKTAWASFVPLMIDLTRPEAMDLSAQVHAVREMYAPLLERRYDAVTARLRDLEQIERLAARFPDRLSLLADMALDPPTWAEDLAGPPVLDEDYLILSTMHSAKGLEFDVVYVIHAADGNIPSYMATGSVVEIEEERRLFYVACTRARDQLYVTHPLRYYTQPWAKADTHGYAQRSRFLTDAVAACFEAIQTGSEGAEPDEGPLGRVTTASIRAGVRSLWEAPAPS
jgi:DNA helicase-2/ATP-dependent DNA helicase PcrA